MYVAFCSYFQKVPTEAPQLELKANYGLVEPVPFEFPPLSSHWTPEAMAAFDLTQRPKDDRVCMRLGFSAHSQRLKTRTQASQCDTVLCFSTCLNVK